MSIPLLRLRACSICGAPKNALKLAHADLRRARGLKNLRAGDPRPAPLTTGGGAAAAGHAAVALAAEKSEAEKEAAAEAMALHHIRGFTSDGAAAAERGGEALAEEDVADLCDSFQDAAISHLEDRVGRAMRAEHEDREGAAAGSTGGPCRTLVVVGGVAANREVGRRLRDLCARGGHRPPKSARERAALEALGAPVWNMHVPPPAACTDNGVMIAWAAVERLALGLSDDPRETFVRPKWPIGELLSR